MPPKKLSYQDIEPLLDRLGDVPGLVLIGGQALNYWAHRFARNNPKLARPFTSKDVDFFGDEDTAKACGSRLDSEPILRPPDNLIAANCAILPFTLDHLSGEIDFVDKPCGLDPAEIEPSALTIHLKDKDGNRTGQSFRVLHPLLLLESRIANLTTLPSRDPEHDGGQALDQARAAIEVTRDFLKMLLDEGRIDAARKLNERIFKFCVNTMDGKTVHARFGLEPFDAILTDPRLPEQFATTRYPQMQRELAKVRAKAKAAHDRAQRFKEKLAAERGAKGNSK